MDGTSVQNLELLTGSSTASAEHGRIAHNRAPRSCSTADSSSGRCETSRSGAGSCGHFEASASRSFRESLEVSPRLSRENPALPRLRREYVQDYHSIGDLLRQQGRTAEAVRLYRESMGPAAEIPRRDGDDWLELAGLLGLAPGRPFTWRRARRGRTGRVPSLRRRCRRALRRALDAGPVNAQRVRFGDEYAVLQTREDFRAVLARAEASTGRPTTADASSRDRQGPAAPLAPGILPKAATPPAGTVREATLRPARPVEHPDVLARPGSRRSRRRASTPLGIVQTELEQLDEARATLGRALATREARCATGRGMPIAVPTWRRPARRSAGSSGGRASWPTRSGRGCRAPGAGIRPE